MTTFSQLGLAEELLVSISKEGYETPTPIQAQAIPNVVEGHDLLGIAQTGTGKTAAFALPIIHGLLERPRRAPKTGCRVLVLSPTRELAAQIAVNFRTYARGIKGTGREISIATIFGGVALRPQIRNVAEGVDVIIATPGRLLDHMSSANVTLGQTEVLVLDEADQMLDLGFVKPIRTVVGAMPKTRQTLMFSATMPKEIKKLASEFLDDPVTVSVAPVSSTAERVDQKVIHTPSGQKREKLASLLSDEAVVRAIVFTRTKRGADRVARHLKNASISVAAIHGDKTQGQREKALGAFRKSNIRVLVATDIAARGIDVPEISHVVNYELPETPEAYVHRIGRTARAGETGVALSLVDVAEMEKLQAIEKLIRKSIPSEGEVPDGDAIREACGKSAKAKPRGRSKSQGARSGQKTHSVKAGGAKVRGGRSKPRGEGGRDDRPERSSDRSDWRPEKTASGRRSEGAVAGGSSAEVRQTRAKPNGRRGAEASRGQDNRDARPDGAKRKPKGSGPRGDNTRGKQDVGGTAKPKQEHRGSGSAAAEGKSKRSGKSSKAGKPRQSSKVVAAGNGPSKRVSRHALNARLDVGRGNSLHRKRAALS